VKRSCDHNISCGLYVKVNDSQHFRVQSKCNCNSKDREGWYSLNRHSRDKRELLADVIGAKGVEIELCLDECV
jgi:hypothetical protein